MKIINGEQHFEINLNSNDMLILHTCLTKYPWPAEEMQPLLVKINDQVQAQSKPVQVPTVAKDLPPLPEGADYIRHQGGMPG